MYIHTGILGTLGSEYCVWFPGWSTTVFYFVMVVHESLVCSEQLNWALFFRKILQVLQKLRQGVHKLSSSTVYIYIYIHIYVLHALTCTHFCVLTCTHFCEILYIWDFLWKKAVAKNLKLLNAQKNIRENANLICSPVILQRCWVWFVLLCEQKRFQIVWLPLWSGAVQTPLKLSHADI